jgi:hypothetical protein
VSCPVQFTRDLSVWRGDGRCWVVDETQQYSVAKMERMMKVQDVLLKAMARKITWWAAAEILGVTDRSVRSRDRRSALSGRLDSHD